MANLFRQSITRPLPAGAEIITKNGKRLARWAVRGKMRTAEVTGEGDAMRIRTESATWYARYRAADGSIIETPTGCRDKSAAASRLAELVGQEEKIKAGVVSAKEVKTASQGKRSYGDTVTAFVQSMTARGCAKTTCVQWTYYLESAGVTGLGWQTLRDMDRADLERWLAMRAVTPKDPEKPKTVMGARVHNAYATAFNAFGMWCFRQGYVKANPFVKMVKRDEKADRRRIRRALTAEELRRLVQAARVRPVQEGLRGNRGKGKAMGKEAAAVSNEHLDRLRWLGETRAMAYWTAAATGLRWGELRSITLGAVRLDANPPHMLLAAKDEKARRGAQIPLPQDLAAALSQYIAERRSRLVGHSGASVVAFPGALDGVPVFDVPEQMSKVFHRDCAAAKIPKRDGAGRVVDVHALRHTFGTMLAKAGVPLQMAQKAMRHSTPALTANVYTHLGLIDVAGAVDRLPAIGAVTHEAAEKVANSVTPTVTPDSDNPWGNGASSGNSEPLSRITHTESTIRISSNAGKGFQGVARKELVGGAGLEPAATGLKVRCSTI